MLGPSRCDRRVNAVQKVSKLMQSVLVATAEKGAETHVHSEFTTKTHDAVTELGYELNNLDTDGFV